MTMPHACASCGGGSKRAYWGNEKRLHVISRCLDCGANYLGPGRWLPRAWATKSAKGLALEVDPHASHRHGHGPCTPTLPPFREGTHAVD